MDRSQSRMPWSDAAGSTPRSLMTRWMLLLRAAAIFAVRAQMNIGAVEDERSGRPEMQSSKAPASGATLCETRRWSDLQAGSGFGTLIGIEQAE
ncbi:hypothetical protein BJF93_07145 [Xaviernesmea oryzae]|uniref:Uncharacterized protein n=1 Tax=Xaviernesmea oryzae TaxID=464029 RepID=A0A1Q9B3N4_9HYPH|nr:hypothetical protein [Xaviernesmea oryzae]OLP62657.1 hypothetical protein BJF93_07145 [Xaviernesmea oryzae]